MVRLLKDTPLNEEQSDYVSVMDESSKALMALVSDLLDVSKMEAGKLVLEQESFNIKSLIQDCSKMIQADLRRKNLSFEATYNTVDLLQVVGDKNRVRQVLLNLMSNAVKFTDEGSIRIHTDATKTSDNQVDLEIAVADTGIGIASSNQRSIFDV
jgi:signal transduction histidine kinase